VLVPDTELLFTAQFHRAGPDLVLTGRDGQHHLVPGYFSSEHHPALVAPNGAHLSPETVDLLAGSPTPGHYAQAQPTTPPDAIGKIEKVVGDVSVVRNGVTVALHVGDAVFKSDVVQAGASASCGISFPDGTVLNLVANTRMALNDYAYDANSNANGALFTLVEGTFAFVAGKVAHSGDMKIATPVATMGIRGTTGVVQEQPNAPATITATAADHTYTFAVVPDIGTGVTGMWDVYLTDANGIIQRDANGNPIVLVTVSQSGYVTYLTPQGLGQPPLVTTEPATNSQYAFEQEMLHQLFLTLNPANLNGNGNNGSSTTPPPFALPNPIPQLFEDSGKPFTINVPNGSSTPTPTIIDIVIGTGPLTVVIWTAGGDGPWSRGPSWLGGAPPTSPQEVEILNPVKVTTDGADSAAGLVINAGAILNIVSGTSFTIYDFIHGGGTVALNSSGSDPTLFIHGAVSLVGGGTIKMLGPSGEDNILGAPGSGAVLINIDYTIEGTGTIGGGDGNLTFENFGIVNANDGLLTVNTGNQVYNDGLMEATADPLAATAGTLQIKDSVVNAGTVQADGAGSAVELSGATFDNLFSVVAKNGGGITFTNVKVTNEAVSATDPAGGTINASGGTITFDGGSLANGNLLEATNGGILQLENITVTNSSAATASVDATSTLDLMGAAILGGTIENDGKVVVTDGVSVLHGGSVTNAGTMTVEAGASLTLEGDTTLINETGGQIKADGGTVAIELDTDTNVNSGTIEAVNGGEVDFYINVEGGSNQGLIEAGAGGTVHFFDTHGGGGGGGGGQGGNHGTMEATDSGVLIFDGGLDNFYLVEAVNGGLIYLNNGIKNHAGTVEASGDGSQISISGGDQSENADTIIAENDGVIALASVVLTNDAHAMIEATSGGSISWITGGIDNYGTFDADGGSITFGGSIGITNKASGIFEAANGGSITFGTSGIGSVTNASGGLIEALSGGTITLDSTLNGAQNAGTIKADGGTIVIDGFEGGNGLFNGDGMGGVGVVEAIHGGKVELAGATIIGGKLHTDSGGIFETVSGTSELINVILTGGTFQIDSGTILDLNGGMNGVAAYIDSIVIFGGNGTVEMDSTSTSIRGGLSNGTLDNQTTIEGRGTIGTGDTPLPGLLTLVNSGTIEAVGGEFDINTGTRNAATTTNSGTLEANGANAVLLIHHTNMNDAGGTIAALNGDGAIAATASVVELLDDVIVGGTLKTSNFGTIETITDNGATTTTVFDGVTNQGYVLVNDNTTLVLRNTIDNSLGNIALAPSGQSDLQIDGTVKLIGGFVELDTSGDAITALATGAVLESSAFIFGQGQIGAGDGKLTLFNNNTIEASLAGKTLIIDTGNTVTNSGGLSALNGGTLNIEDSVINNETIFSQGSGSDVELSGATLDNFGTIGPDASATMTLTGVAVTNENVGTFSAGTSGQLFFSGGSVANVGRIEADSDGKITFENNVSVTNDGGTIEALGSVITGADIIFDSSAGGVTNKNGGIIEADQGTVSFGAIIITNSGGTIEAFGKGGLPIFDSSAAVNLNGTTIDGGTLTTDSKGVIDALTGTSTFDGVTIAGGFIKAETGAIIDLEDKTTVSGTVTFEGGGTFVLDPDPASIVGGASGGTLDIAAGATLTGSGDIGNAGSTSLTLNNAGTIDADGDGAEIDIHTGNTVTNTGLLEATNDGALEIDDAVNNAGGTIEALHGGTITFEDEGSLDESSATAGIAGGTVEATGNCSTITFENVTVKLDSAVAGGGGTIKASNGGAIIFNGGTINCATSAPVSGGTIEALTCGTVTFNGTTVYNQGSSIEADGIGAMILLAGATILGGTLETSACGVIETVACSGNSTLDGVTIATGSAIQVDDHTSLTLQDTIDGNHTITNDGTITLVQGCDPSLIINCNITLAGSGTVVLGGDTDSIVGTGKGTNTLHNANTIVGSGTIGGDDLVFINQACGVVDADVCGHTLVLDTGSTIRNAGLLEATSGGTLEIEDNVCNTACGVISASGHDSVVQLDGITITGGTLETSCGGLIQVVCGDSTFDNLTIGSAAAVEVTNGATLTLEHTVNSSGTITVDCDATLYLSNVALDGGTIKDIGTVEVTVDSTVGSNAVIDGDVGSLVIDCGHALTFDTATLENLDVTNHGALDVNIDTTLTLSNVAVHGGAIDGADATTGDLASTIDVTGDSTFCGVHLSGGDLTVEAGVTMTLSGDRVSDVAINGTDASGCIVASTIDVTADSTFCDVSLSGGDLTVEAGVTMTLAAGDSGATLDGVTVTDNGALDVGDSLADSGAILTLDDGTTITGNGAGTMTVNANNTVDVEDNGGGGATLDGVIVTLNGALDVGDVLSDSGAILTLDDGTTVTGNGAGTMTINANNTVDVEDNGGGGATLDGVIVTLNGALDVGDVLSDSGAILTLDDGTTVTGNGTGTMTINAGNTVDVENGNNNGGGATLDGVKVTLNGALDVGDVLSDSGAILTLDDGTTVTGNGAGTMTINANNTVDVEHGGNDGSGGATLDGVHVTDNGALDIGDVSSGAILTLDDGTTITGNGTGTLTINADSTLDIEHGGNDGSGATLEDIKVTNNGTLLVEGNATLTLSSVTIHGGTITDNGKIEVAGAVTIDSNAVISANQLTIDNDDTLTLGAGVSDTVTLSGTVDNCGTIAIGDSTLVIAGGETLTLDGNGIVTLAGGIISGSTGPTYGTLTNNGNTIEGYGQIGIGEPNILTLNNEIGGTIEALGVGETLTIEIHSAINNAGTLAAAAGATLQINVGTINNTGNIQLEGTLLVAQPTANGHQLTLNDGGTVTLDGGSILGIRNGEILDNHGNTIQGDGNIGGGNLKLTLDNDAGGIIDANVASHALSINTGANAIVNAGTMEASDGGTLSIASAVTNSGSITDNDGSILSFNNVTITNTGDINLDGTTSITNLIIHGGLTLEGGNGSSTGPGQVILGGSWNTVVSDLNAGHHDTLTNVDNTISGAGTIGDADLTLVNQHYGVIDADVSGQTLLINTGTNAVTNAGLLEATGGGTLDIQSSVTNTGTLFAGSGSKVDVGGSISGGSATIQHGTLEFDASSDVNVTFDNSLGYGKLVLGDVRDFSGEISGFYGTAADATDSDEIDLTGFIETGYSVQVNGDDKILTLHDANGHVVTLTFEDFNRTLNVSTSGGKTVIYDPPAAGAKDAPATVTAASDGHTNAPANQVAHATDHATSLSNLFGFGGDQDSVPAATWHDNELAVSGDQLALGDKSVIAPPGAPALGGVPAGSSFVNGVADGGVGETGAGATNDGSSQSLLSSLLKTLTDGTAPSIDLGSGHGQTAIAPAPAPLTTAPSNEHATAPTQVTSLPAASPTIASASFGTMGNDSFAFHASLGSDAAQNAGAQTSELAHNNIQVSGPALASIVPEFHQEFAFDAIHQDAATLAATVDQFHQMAANSTLLH
jgi:hypothetical protein